MDPSPLTEMREFNKSGRIAIYQRFHISAYKIVCTRPFFPRKRNPLLDEVESRNLADL
jgi:hypothetical protein